MTSRGILLSFATLGAVAGIMLVERVLSRHNEQALRARGALEPPDDVYGVMRWAYPGCFLAMAGEGAVAGPPAAKTLAAGLVLFGLAKALKLSAMAALGPRWSFRVLVVPGLPIVTSGPYRWLRHPNYVAVFGEIVAVAAIVGAPLTGVAALVVFGWLIRKRIEVEDRALGRR